MQPVLAELTMGFDPEHVEQEGRPVEVGQDEEVWYWFPEHVLQDLQDDALCWTELT